MLGGSSSKLGLPLEDGSLATAVPDTDTSAADVEDGRDTIDTGDGDDVVLGDNGRITRPLAGASSSALATLLAVPTYRDVAMADLAADASSGSDVITGGEGNDILYGQLDDSTADGLTPTGDGDELHGDAGEDVIVGDLAVVTLTAAFSVGGAPRPLSSNSGAIIEDVYPAGSWVPVTVATKELAAKGGSDTAFGGDGDDVLRLGANADLANGDAGDDVVFGGAGNDALWGGIGHDRIFGGHGADDLDLKLTSDNTTPYADVAGLEDRDNVQSTLNGDDFIYGGWGPDELQADQGGAGGQPGSDHLVDWVGAHNVYYVCAGPYGAGRVIRQSSPDLVTMLNELVKAAGGTALTTKESGGWFDLGLVTNADNNKNSKPSAGGPGNFTCETG